MKQVAKFDTSTFHRDAKGRVLSGWGVLWLSAAACGGETVPIGTLPAGTGGLQSGGSSHSQGGATAHGGTVSSGGSRPTLDLGEMHELECSPTATCRMKFQWQAPSEEFSILGMNAGATCTIGMARRRGAFSYRGQTRATLLPEEGDQVIAVDDACQTIVGSHNCQNSLCPASAVRWSLAGGPTERIAGVPEDTDAASGAEAWAISGDGRVIAASHFLSNGYDKAYWVESDGAVSVMAHDASWASALSADGTVAAGSVRTPEGYVQAAIWSRDERWLPVLPDGWAADHFDELSSDGKLGIGVMTRGGLEFRAFLWRLGQDIEVLDGDGAPLQILSATSSGDALTAAHPIELSEHRAALWRRDVGWVDLTTEITSAFLDAPEGLVLTEAILSGDGRTLVGNGTLGSGQHIIWRAESRP